MYLVQYTQQYLRRGMDLGNTKEGQLQLFYWAWPSAFILFGRKYANRWVVLIAGGRLQAGRRTLRLSSGLPYWALVSASADKRLMEARLGTFMRNLMGSP